MHRIWLNDQLNLQAENCYYGNLRDGVGEGAVLKLLKIINKKQTNKIRHKYTITLINNKK